jgi:hypothetical protein
MAGVKNLNAFMSAMERAKTNLKSTVTQRYQKFVFLVLQDLALNTPQWSGDLAASWQVVTGAKGSPTPLPATGFKANLPGKGYEWPAPHQKGDRPAVDYALVNNSFIIESIRWNSKVSIQNINPTQDKLSEEALRPVNRPEISGDIMAAAYVAARWSTKTRVLLS